MSKGFIHLFWGVALGSLVLASSLLAESPATPKEPEPVNKLQKMFELYYLPFSIEFAQGKTFNDIFPMAPDKFGQFTKLLKPEELKTLDKDYEKIREDWKKKSLFLNTPVEVGESNHVSRRLVSHHIALTRGAWDGVSVSTQIQANALLEGKSEEIKKSVEQIYFLRNLLKPYEDEKFNFFVVGPSWCESSKEYRYILEHYAKIFPNSELVLHSLVIEDPKEDIFDSRILKVLFPHPQKYSHESVPRFLALQVVKGKPILWEEGEALTELTNRYFKKYRGFANEKASLFAVVPGPLVPVPQPLLLASPGH